MCVSRLRTLGLICVLLATGVTAHAERLIFGSFRTEANAQNWAAKLSRSFGQQTNLDRHLRSHELQEALSRGDQIDDVMTEHFDKAEAVDERNEMPGGEKDDDDDGVGTEYDVDGDVMCDVITHEHNAKPLILD